MINFATMTPGARLTMARKFLADNGLAGPSGTTITRDSFDLWIIDNGMAQDPGTDDTRELAYKGFVQQRTYARAALNRWAKMLPEPDSFAVETDKERPELYFINTWSDNAFALAADIGNRVEKFSRNKVRHVRSMHQLAVDKHLDEQDTTELIQMISLLEGHGLVMQRQIKAEVAKFNRAVEMVEQSVAARIAAPDAAVNT